MIKGSVPGVCARVMVNDTLLHQQKKEVMVPLPWRLEYEFMLPMFVILSFGKLVNIKFGYSTKVKVYCHTTYESSMAWYSLGTQDTLQTRSRKFYDPREGIKLVTS